jgi:hypothetical protein
MAWDTDIPDAEETLEGLPAKPSSMADSTPASRLVDVLALLV